MIQSEVVVRPHNMARYPIPLSCMSIQETSSEIRAPQNHEEMTEKMHNSAHQNDTLGTRNIPLWKSRVPVSQEHQQIWNEYVGLSRCFGRLLFFRKINNITDSLDRGMRF